MTGMKKDNNDSLLEQFRADAADETGGGNASSDSDGGGEDYSDASAANNSEAHEAPDANSESPEEDAADTAPEAPADEPIADHDEFADEPNYEASGPEDVATREEILDGARAYPVQAFAYAVQNRPEAAPEVLAQLSEANPTAAFALLMDFVQSSVEEAASNAVQPFAERTAAEDARNNAHAAHERVVSRIKDAHDLADHAAKVVEERFKHFNSTDPADMERFIQDAYDIARGRAAAEGGYSPASKSERKASPPPVASPNAAGATSGADSGEDAWDGEGGMKNYLSALGL